MWIVTNETPYAVGRTWGRDKHGVHEWIVVAKATFDIKHSGQLDLAEVQPPPLLAPEYYGGDVASSLRYESDLVGCKPATDILLNGTAYAPRGLPATEFLVTLRVGTIKKSIQVIGDRTWQRGAFGTRPSAPEPVSKVPIVYERAYGGYAQLGPEPADHRMDARNPVGCGLVTTPGLPVPNFMYPRGRMDKDGPAGFGAVASYWSPRRELGGTYDDVWQKSQFPLLPKDWDSRTLLCSPADQRQDGYLEGGQLVELENLTPDGVLRFAIPRINLRFRTLIDRRIEEQASQLATVIIEPDHPRVIFIWQSVLMVRNDGDYLDRTVVSYA